MIYPTAFGRMIHEEDNYLLYTQEQNMSPNHHFYIICKKCWKMCVFIIKDNHKHKLDGDQVLIGISEYFNEHLYKWCS